MLDSIPPLSCLIRLGSDLAKLKHKIKEGSSRSGNGNTNQTQISDLLEQVKYSTNQLCEEYKAQAPLVDESMENVISKIEKLIQDFMEVDKVNGKYYEELAEKVKSFKNKMQQASAVPVLSMPAGDSSGEHKTISHVNSQEESNFTTKFEGLSGNEKKCLFCFCLFPNEVGIKKRDLIYWWLGMGFISPGSDGVKAAGEQVVAKLMSVGFIDGPIRNNFCSIFKMCDSVSSKIQQAIRDSYSLMVAEERFFRMMKLVNDEEPGNIEALLNIGEHTFNSRTFDRLSKMKNARVVHLGSWRDHLDNTDSIVVEDIEALKALKQLVEVRFLSLGGISGIVHLPDSVCKLEKLEILDLRACNNLESLPQGIGSLKQLRQLDMSECYQLDHIPKAIVFLSELIILKGFVIKQDPDSEVGSNGKRKSKTSSCSLSDLTELKQLRKLSIRTRRMNFPTREDLQTLCQMELNKLGIAWVGNSSDAQTDSDLEKFPVTVEKLELQIAPKCAASRLLELISMQRANRLKKLYIKGGGLRKLDPMKHNLVNVKVVRLRYLSKLDMDWDQFIESFPNLTHLQIFECPNLAFFPCDDNGTWER